ncbi:uncharacterized protein DNG_05022 [Cephalotrichum gorgonifer]|uniref:DUF7492 domain-containing protein n=1 Tax=Cephalotrichum gorgonifer TaxID=2041049 RepID=A0AAE8MZ63_9PEZI|nr:uncharacterized protein DNG_05022 [Cephalotrichum gorgonifer]
MSSIKTPFSRMASAAALVVFLAGTITPANAHTWVEQVRRIASNGTFTGNPGYSRGMIARGTPGFADDNLVYLLPPNGRGAGGILDTDKIARFSKNDYTSDLPRLSASPGEFIALRYQENGHVSLPDAPPNKPLNRGTVFIYGTDDASDDDTLLDIHRVWNTEGTGGDKRGKLIATRNYDDGQCSQRNGGPISTSRGKKFAKGNDPLQGDDLWCQVDVLIPEDVKPGSTYTMYWVWDWPTLAPELVQASKNGIFPTQGEGVVVPQLYTSAVDIDIASTNVIDAVGNLLFSQSDLSTYAEGQDPTNRAIKKQLEEMFLVSPEDGVEKPDNGAEKPGSGGDSGNGDDSSSDGGKITSRPSATKTASDAPAATAIGSDAPSSDAPSSDAPSSDAPIATQAPVTVTVTLEPTTLVTIVTKTVNAVSAPTPTPDEGGLPDDGLLKAKPSRRWARGLY